MATKLTALASWHSLNQTLGADCLRVASYNIHRCVGRDRQMNVDRVAQVILELGLRPIERRFQVRQMLGVLREIPAERSFPAGLPLFALDRVWVRPRRPRRFRPSAGENTVRHRAGAGCGVALT